MKMNREKLEHTFCWKINSELKLFKYRILQKEKEEVFALAYQIDCIISIYEILVEYCKEMTTQELEVCMSIPEVLIHLYCRWMKVPDSKNEELGQSIRASIQEKKKEAA